MISIPCLTCFAGLPRSGSRSWSSRRNTWESVPRYRPLVGCSELPRVAFFEGEKVPRSENFSLEPENTYLLLHPEIINLKTVSPRASRRSDFGLPSPVPFDCGQSKVTSIVLPIRVSTRNSTSSLPAQPVSTPK